MQMSNNKTIKMSKMIDRSKG